MSSLQRRSACLSVSVLRYKTKNADPQKRSLRRSWVAVGWTGLACVISSSSIVNKTNQGRF